MPHRFRGTQGEQVRRRRPRPKSRPRLHSVSLLSTDHAILTVASEMRQAETPMVFPKVMHSVYGRFIAAENFGFNLIFAVLVAFIFWGRIIFHYPSFLDWAIAIIADHSVVGWALFYVAVAIIGMNVLATNRKALAGLYHYQAVHCLYVSLLFCGMFEALSPVCDPVVGTARQPGLIRWSSIITNQMWCAAHLFYSLLNLYVTLAIYPVPRICYTVLRYVIHISPFFLFLAFVFTDVQPAYLFFLRKIASIIALEVETAAVAMSLVLVTFQTTLRRQRASWIVILSALFCLVDFVIRFRPDLLNTFTLCPSITQVICRSGRAVTLLIHIVVRFRGFFR